ncbi:MAG: hypothetical protein HY319_02405 [Armatimonadetes bacterium]|nr:hypothetical protein [Armatimonadota bacterium]
MKHTMLALLIVGISYGTALADQGWMQSSAVSETRWTSSAVAPAAVQPTPEQVAQLEPFTLEANYMSLPGYYRYLVYDQSGVWLTRGQAVAAVDQGIEAVGR